jgi:hypothetical protein
MALGRDLADSLDFDTPDRITELEWFAFAEAHGRPLGHPDGLPAYRLFYEGSRPDVLKRLRLQLRAFPPGPDERPLTPGLFADLHSYILLNFQVGVEYALRLLKRVGHTRAEVMDVFALATLHTCSLGLSDTCLNHAAMDQLRDWPTTAAARARPEYPDGWAVDRDAFSSGLDFRNLDATSEEVELVHAWYRRWTGEVPGWVLFLSQHNPRLLKMLRNKLEHALTALPKQFVPFLGLGWEVTRHNPLGVREQLLLARGFGISREQALDAIMFAATTYGGPSSLSVVNEAAGDVLHEWQR